MASQHKPDWTLVSYAEADHEIWQNRYGQLATKTKPCGAPAKDTHASIMSLSWRDCSSPPRYAWNSASPPVSCMGLR